MTPPVLALVAGIEAATLAQAVTALVGFFVAYQAYRGYRRNDSRPMLFLGVGIAFVTTVSFVVSTLVVSPLGASEGVTILSWVLANVIGLAAIFYAFTGAGRSRGGREPGYGPGPRQAPGGESGTASEGETGTASVGESGTASDGEIGTASEEETGTASDGETRTASDETTGGASRAAPEKKTETGPDDQTGTGREQTTSPTRREGRQ